jgi:hypothetical protein
MYFLVERQITDANVIYKTKLATRTPYFVKRFDCLLRVSLFVSQGGTALS